MGPREGGSRPRPRAYGESRNNGRTGAAARQRPGLDRERERRRPASRRPERKKPKAPIWTKLTIVFGAIVMVLSGAVVVLPTVLANWALGDIPQAEAIPDELKGDNIDGPIDFLLLGTDAGSAAQGSSEHDGRRTDSIVLLHIPASHDIAYMISFPRDLYVPIAPSPDRCGGPNDGDKIAHAYFFGLGNGDAGNPDDRGRAAARTAKTISCMVEDTGGLTFEGAAIINFDGFERMIEAIDGVNLCFDTDVWSIHRAADGSKKDFYVYANSNQQLLATRPQRYHYPKGECRDLTAWQALDYARQRYDTALDLADRQFDYDRQRHQQQLLRAMVAKVATANTLTNFETVVKVKDAAAGMLTLDLNDIPIQDWVLTLSGLRPDKLVMIKTNGGRTLGDWAYTETGDRHYLGEKYTAEFKQLLQHVQNGTVYDFLSVHPDWIAADAQTAAG